MTTPPHEPLPAPDPQPDQLYPAYPPPGSGAPSGHGAPPRYGTPPGGEAAPRYGTPPGGEAAPGYGLPLGYVTPAGGWAAPGYGTPPAYGVPPRPGNEMPGGFGMPAAGYGMPQPYYPYPYVVKRPYEGLAVASLVVSCAGVFGLCTYGIGGVLGIVGAILGHFARSRLRHNGREGDGLALAGIIVGWALAAVSAVIVTVLIVLIAGGSDDTI